uniref:(northern house mosquito) hypothetical protein n=1 Tax=Culex pipiens TaxID=7175 RepID=A0A8D8IRL8_CULPI
MRFSAMCSNFSPFAPPFQVNFICRTFCIRSFQHPLSSPYKMRRIFSLCLFQFRGSKIWGFFAGPSRFSAKNNIYKKKSFSSLLIHLLFSSFFRFFMFPRLCRCFRGRFGRPAWSRGTTTLV